MNKYQYKLVLVCAGAGTFRGGDWNYILTQLKGIDVNSRGRNRWSIQTQEDLDYAFKLQNRLTKISNADVRVESPWITIYSNDKQDLESIVKIDKSKVKYMCVPPVNVALTEDTIIMPKMKKYDYRITMGKTTQNHEAFIQWAESNAKIKLTKSCRRELLRDRSYGGTFFYITGDNNLLLAKMHLGSSINKVERIVKA